MFKSRCFSILGAALLLLILVYSLPSPLALADRSSESTATDTFKDVDILGPFMDRPNSELTAPSSRNRYFLSSSEPYGIEGMPKGKLVRSGGWYEKPCKLPEDSSKFKWASHNVDFYVFEYSSPEVAKKALDALFSDEYEQKCTEHFDKMNENYKNSINLKTVGEELTAQEFRNGNLKTGRWVTITLANPHIQVTFNRNTMQITWKNTYWGLETVRTVTGSPSTGGSDITTKKLLGHDWIDYMEKTAFARRGQYILVAGVQLNDSFQDKELEPAIFPEDLWQTVSAMVSSGRSQDHDIRISWGPQGSANPASPGQTIECIVDAQDSLGHELKYKWTALGSALGFNDPTLKRPTWTAQPNNTQDVVNWPIAVEVYCDHGASVKRQYVQKVQPGNEHDKAKALIMEKFKKLPHGPCEGKKMFGVIPPGACNNMMRAFMGWGKYAPIFWPSFDAMDAQASKFEDFTCGSYQTKVLEMLDKMRLHGTPAEQEVFKYWDYGPIMSEGTWHQVVVIYPKGSSWRLEGVVLDPWPTQKPEAMPLAEWMKKGSLYMAPMPSFFWNGQYPLTGGKSYPTEPPPDPTAKQKRTQRLLSPEQKKHYGSLRSIKMKLDYLDKVGAEMEKANPNIFKSIATGTMSPVQMLITDSAGRRSGWVDAHTFVNEIPAVELTEYDEPDNTKGMVALLPLATYQVTITARQKGTFSLLRAMPEEFTTAALAGTAKRTIAPGDSFTYTLSPDEPMTKLVKPGIPAIPFTDMVSWTGHEPSNSNVYQDPGGPFGGGDPVALVDQLRIRVEDRQVRPDAFVTVPVWLEFPKTFSRTRGGRINVANLNVEIEYDPSIVKPANEVIKGNLLDNVIFQANTTQSGTIKIGFASKQGVMTDGTLAQIPLQVVGQPGQTSPLKVKVTTVNDSNGRTPAVVTTDGSVQVLEAVVNGDINGNGIVDAGDALAALKMSVGLIEEDLVLNVDKQNGVTSNDARLLLEMAVQGDVTPGTTGNGDSTTPGTTGSGGGSTPGTIGNGGGTAPGTTGSGGGESSNITDTPASADARRAYQEYIAAYNKMTSLMAKGQRDTPEAMQAYEAYKIAKEKYEAAMKDAPPAVSDESSH